MTRLIIALLAIALGSMGSAANADSTPEDVNAAQGKPPSGYWQQQVDYDIDVELLEEEQSISAVAVVIYKNNSPATLERLWFSTTETGFEPESLANRSKMIKPGPGGAVALPSWEVAWGHAKKKADARFKVDSVTTSRGADLAFRYERGLLGVTLDRPLPPGRDARIAIRWYLKLGDLAHIPERAGYEYFPATDNYQFSVGRWLPRALIFRPGDGWVRDPFLGEGEFSGEFGDYDVRITVPGNHVVAATGALVNPREVLSADQVDRLKDARSSEGRMFIVSPDEARRNEHVAADGTKTWRFEAANVRDFAWSSSPKFVWDAAGYRQPGANIENVMLMSFYPYESAGLWSRYSTAAMRHTLDVYRRFAFDYPYPTLQSVNSYSFPTGIEYPMMGFTGPRPHYDRDNGLYQYGRRERDALVELVIHESGHSYFPMIVNTNERRYAWMDEGLNTFLNHIAVLEWHDSPGVLFGKPAAMLFPMSLGLEPRKSLMTPVDQMPNFFSTIYFKAAGALVLLREDVLGRPVFDEALREYSRRWAFKQPTPVDFFNTFEDVSGQELDWFWDGWFFGTETYDMGIAGVIRFNDEPPPRPAPPPQSPDATAKPAAPPPPPPEALTLRGNRVAKIGFRVDDDPSLQDYYDAPLAHGSGDKDAGAPDNSMQQWLGEQLQAANEAMPVRYGVRISNVGGLILPITLRLFFEDESTRDIVVPPEAWRYGDDEIVVPVMESRNVVRFMIDPEFRHPDADPSNNSFAGELIDSFMLPPRLPGDPRGEMAGDGVAVDADGQTVTLDNGGDN